MIALKTMGKCFYLCGVCIASNWFCFLINRRLVIPCSILSPLEERSPVTLVMKHTLLSIYDCPPCSSSSHVGRYSQPESSSDFVCVLVCSLFVGWLVCLVACFLVCLLVYLFWGSSLAADLSTFFVGFLDFNCCYK